MQGNPKYDGFCSRCFSYLFPNDLRTPNIRGKSKEIAVRDYINTHFEGFIHDKPIWLGNKKDRRRIDHYKLIQNTYLCIETDENQHKSYKDEEKRYHDIFNGFKFIFIRFNPDKYKEYGLNKNPLMKTRLITLEDEMKKQILRIENENDENVIDLLEIIKLYYNEN